ncbi:MAG: helicase, partial [Acidobacteria bacterium]|nr:helicase [Acidobacteriota bacterium]
MTPPGTHSSGPTVHTPNINQRSSAAGREYFLQDRVKDLAFESATGLLRGKVSGSSVYSTTAKLVHGVSGQWTAPVGICSCPVRQNCKHVAALIFAARADPYISELLIGGNQGVAVTAAPASADWEQSLRGLLPSGDSQRDNDRPPLALQFEVERPKPRFTYRNAAPSTAEVELNVRPVLLGARGTWIRTGIAWNTLNYLNYSRKFNEQHLDWLIELLQSHSPGGRAYNSAAAWLPLSTYSGRNFWDMLERADHIGLALVLAGPAAQRLTVQPEGAGVSLDIDRTVGGDLRLGAQITVGSDSVDPADVGILGKPPIGIFYPTDSGLSLAALRDSPSPAVLDFATHTSPLLIPAADEDKFLSQYYPQLLRTAKVASSDESVELPQYTPPVLSLLASYAADHVLRLHWEWHYPVGSRINAQPLWPFHDDVATRDDVTEQRIIASVGKIWEQLPQLGESPNGIWGEPRLRATATLRGLETMTFTEEVLPALNHLPDVVVDIEGAKAEYREVLEAPVVKISTQQSSERDWFDLGIVVTLEGEPVSFAAIFSALAAGQTRLLLPSGAHFSLDLPEMHQLRELIDEARALGDQHGDGLRISRFQAGLWDELAQLGVVDEQAAAWRSTVSGLLRGGSAEPLPAPAMLNASLRPYQLEGFNWLRFL